MDLQNYINSLKSLASISNYPFNDILDINGIRQPRNFFLIQTITSPLGIKDYMPYKFNHTDLEFFIKDKYAGKYMIRKQGDFIEDPYLFYENELYMEQSSAFLLIELADWYFSKSDFTYAVKHTSLYPDIYSLCDKNEIRAKKHKKRLFISKRLGAFFIMDMNYDPWRFRIVARDGLAMGHILENLGVLIRQEDRIPYISDIISDGIIIHDKVKGKMQLAGNKEVDVSAIPDDGRPGGKRFDKLIKKWNRSIKEKMTPEYLDILKKKAAREITDASYPHEGLDPAFIEKKIRQLYEEMELTEIRMYDDSLVLEFEAKNELPDFSINCILNKKLNIDECTMD